MEGPVDELMENAAFEAAYFGEVGTR
jgi:hypothetical protein